jgi:WXXGXW repeat (2 copies)
MWSPGYWAWDEDYGDYYWVPGVWVEPPEVGLLWTPGFWGWEDGGYIWHAGYWGPHVGFYGGINYGWGYFGAGFVGGVWAGNVFRYNTAVWHVDPAVVHNTFVDRTVINNQAGNRYSFNGPHGVTATPTAADQAALRERHSGATDPQQQHALTARNDRNQRYSVNHGQPTQTTLSRVGAAGPQEHRAATENRVNATQPGHNAGPATENRVNTAQPGHNAGPATNHEQHNAGNAPPQHHAVTASAQHHAGTASSQNHAGPPSQHQHTTASTNHGSHNAPAHQPPSGGHHGSAPPKGGGGGQKHGGGGGEKEKKQ